MVIIIIIITTIHRREDGAEVVVEVEDAPTRITDTPREPNDLMCSITNQVPLRARPKAARKKRGV